MDRERRSPLRRALGACQEALGVRSGPDPLDVIVEAAEEVQERLQHLREEVRLGRHYPGAYYDAYYLGPRYLAGGSPRPEQSS